MPRPAIPVPPTAAVYGEPANSDPGDHVVFIQFTLILPDLVEDSRFYLRIPKYQLVSFNLCDWSPYLVTLCNLISSARGTLSRVGAGDELGNVHEDWLREPGTSRLEFVANRPSVPIDPDIINTRVSGTSTNSREQEFVDAVSARDQTCVFMDVAAADAMHIIPFSKGDTYIRATSNARSAGVDPVVTINDPRNGILGNPLLHRYLGSGDIAILKTPAFDHSTPPPDPLRSLPILIDSPHLNPAFQADEARYTLHYFANIYDPRLRLATNVPDMSPNFSTLVRNPNHPETPPDWIFHTTYAGAALNAWGPSRGDARTIFTKWRDHYYDDSEYEDDGDSDDDDDEGGHEKEKKGRKNTKDRKQNTGSRGHKENRGVVLRKAKRIDDFIDLAAIAPHLFAGHTIKSPGDRARDKVGPWLQNVSNPKDVVPNVNDSNSCTD